MAIIASKQLGRQDHLRSHHTIGRREDADSPLSEASVSRMHAAIEWDGKSWRIKDLSRNGTWVNNERIGGDLYYPLTLGDQICFGTPDSAAWELIDVSEPQSALFGLAPGSVDAPLDQFTLLPDESNPTLAIFYSVSHGAWVYSHVNDSIDGGAAHVLQHGETLESGAHSWRVFLADTSCLTEAPDWDQQQLEDYEFVFELSLDEEVTELQLEHNAHTHNLGARSHHYLLMHLARVRAEQAQEGLDQKSQGWMYNEELVKDLGIEMSHLNIWIYRARKQIADVLSMPVESENLVQRRKGRLRFGCPQFRIYKGAELEYSMRDQQTH